MVTIPGSALTGDSLTYSGNRFSLFRKLLWLRLALLLSCLTGIVVLKFFLNKEFSYLPLVIIVVIGGSHSIYAWINYTKQANISDWLLAKQLLIDGILLVSLVWFSGRSTNPFIYYLLVIIAISASIFPARFLWAFSFGGVATYTFLMYFDFNQHLLHMPQDFQLHLLGMWLNFVGSALLISFFVSRLTTALRDREIQLAAIREETLKNEQLIGIGTLAASTVHSLGTPLSTIAVSIGELKAESAEHRHYLDLIQAQVERCKQIMSKLSLLANSDSENSELNTLGSLIEDIQEYFLLVNANPQPEFIFDEKYSNLTMPGNLLLKHALSNLIDNAIHAASTKVTVDFKIEDAQLNICIEDDGVGIPVNIANNFGKPVKSSKEDGLGIGIFLANSTIEKLNGKVSFYGAGERSSKTTKVLINIPVHTNDD